MRSNQDSLSTQWKGHLDAGDYAQALGVYSSAVAAYPNDETMHERYIESIEGLKRQGDSAFEKRDFGHAERIYRALLDGYPGYARFAGRLSFAGDQIRERVSLCEITTIETTARKQISQGDYHKGLDTFRATLPKYRKDLRFLKAYAGAAEEVKQRADSSFEHHDFARAGRICRALSTHIPAFESFSPAPSFTRRSIETCLTESSSSLAKKGFELYRQGKIAEAIPVWKSILVFDNNQDIRKAIATASDQLKRLKK
jgi:tetratricopeptide (TPR) repeat protein